MINSTNSNMVEALMIVQKGSSRPGRCEIGHVRKRNGPASPTQLKLELCIHHRTITVKSYSKILRKAFDLRRRFCYRLVKGKHDVFLENVTQHHGPSVSIGELGMSNPNEWSILFAGSWLC
jgi:hypothetical protein